MADLTAASTARYASDTGQLVSKTTQIQALHRT